MVAAKGRRHYLKQLIKSADPAKKYYRTLFDATDDIIIVTDGTAVFDANRMFRKHFPSFDPETDRLGDLFEAIDKYGFVYEGYRGEPWYRSVLEKNRDHYKVGIRRDGCILIFNLALQPFEPLEGIYVATLTEMTDFVSYKHVLEEDMKICAHDQAVAKHRLDQYSRAVDESNMVSKTDLAGVITDVNDVFCRMMKYRREELIGAGHGIIHSPDTPAEVYEALWETIKAGKVWKGVLQAIDKEGMGHFFNTTISPIRDLEGNIVEYIAIRQDVTALFEAKEAALRALKVKTTFLDHVSHELRTPLNAIVNFIEQVIEDFDEIGSDDAVRAIAKRCLDRSSANARHLARLIDSLLDMAKIDAGKEDFVLKPAELRETLAQIYHDTVSLTRDKAIDYRFVPDVAEGWAMIDAVKFRQVMYNLISNAIKFTPGGSVSIGLEEDEACYYVTVRDNGVGIPQEKIAAIFESFVQVNSFDVGTGLGLAIVKEYCKGMMIEIFVTSTVNEGSVFRLMLKKTTESWIKGQ